jgi:hypothetical protein
MRNPLSSFNPFSESSHPWTLPLIGCTLPRYLSLQHLRVLGAAVFLVVIPVFFQAPLVRSLPWLSLTLTGAWLMAGLGLASRTNYRLWGDLLVGFTWTWFAGSLYWGWFRWEPLLHIPVETLGIPVVLFLLRQGRGRVGSYFYLGSLLGTAVTDLYIYWTDLLPFWRQVMQLEPQGASVILQEAASSLQEPVDMSRALLLILGLLTVGLLPLRSPQLCWWAFSGAVLSTVVVDLLFLSSAFLL